MNNILFFVKQHIKASYLFLTILSLLFLYFTIGLSTLLIFYLLICLVFLYFALIHTGAKVTAALIFAFPLVIAFSFFFVVQIVFDGAESKDVEIALSPEECKILVEKYDEKLLKIEATDLIGQAKIDINPDDCKTTITYVFQFSADLEPQKFNEALLPYMGYFVEHASGEDRKNWDGRGEISTAFNNVGQLPNLEVEEPYGFYSDNTKVFETTQNFYHTYSTIYTFSDERYENLFKNTKYYVLDGREYIVVETVGDGSQSISLDSQNAAPVAPIVKKFDLTITELD